MDIDEDYVWTFLLVLASTTQQPMAADTRIRKNTTQKTEKNPHILIRKSALLQKILRSTWSTP